MIKETKEHKHIVCRSGSTADLPVVRFVGIHNKRGMKPLDSKTMSGKLIDAVIRELPFGCSKTNLCEVEYVPADDFEIDQAAVLWYEKYEPKNNDVIVLLGSWVHQHFRQEGFDAVKLPHPASMFGNVNREKYISNAVTQIMKAAGWFPCSVSIPAVASE